MGLLLLLLTALVVGYCLANRVPSESHHHQQQQHRSHFPTWYRHSLIHVRHEGGNNHTRHDSIRHVHVNRTNNDQQQQRHVYYPRVTETTSTSRHHVGQRYYSEVTTSQPHKHSDIAPRSFTFTGFRQDNYHYRQRPTDTHQGYPRNLVTTESTTHPGRRVCTRQIAPTSPATLHHRRDRQIRFVYTELTSSTFSCCPGWTQVTRLSYGCNKPICTVPCMNGGVCSSPERCTCLKGFTGSHCQTDIDECVTEKPCAQLCRNLPGTYECYCRPDFQLQPDRQSCRKNETEDDSAFEARDLEGDYVEILTSTTTKRPDTENEVGDEGLEDDYEIIMKRLTKLEKQVARGKKRDTDEATEMSAKITLAVESINEIKRTVENVQLMQQEFYEMRNKMKQLELEARRNQHLANRIIELENRLRARCRSLLPISPPSNHF